MPMTVFIHIKETQHESYLCAIVNNNIDKLETLQRMAARFVVDFYDYSPTADLSGKIQKILNWLHCNIVELLQMCVCSIN